MAKCDVSADAQFSAPKIEVSICKFSLKLPSFSFNLTLPPIPFPPSFLPIFNFNLALSCDLSKPMDVSAGLAFGGGRIPCFDPDPDLDYNS